MKIQLTVKNYRPFADDKPARFIVQDGVTGFVGVNNAGKSSVLKLFYEFRGLFANLSAPNGSVIQAAKRSPQAFSPSVLVGDNDELFHDLNSNRRNITIDLKILPDGDLPTGDEGRAMEVTISVPRASNTFVLDVPGIPQPSERLSLSFRDSVLSGGEEFRSVDMALIFEACRRLANMMYIGSFRNAIHVGGQAQYYDIAIGQDFIKAWKNFKSGPNKRRNEAAYEVTHELAQLLRYNSLDINPAENEQTLQLFINGKSRRLLDLGSGFAQIVIVLANVAVKEPTYVLIDEPELSLHPALQLEFMTVLRRFAKCGVLFATHSIPLARSAADWVYCVRSIPGQGSELLPLSAAPRLWELLNELTFNGYRDLGYEQILLVEGPTEIRAIQQLLRLYRKEHKVVPLSLGGSDLINGNREAELQEIKRICDRVSALIDSERSSEGEPLSKDRLAFVELCSNIGIGCHVLDRRALENYFPDAAIQSVYGEKYRSLGPFEKRTNARHMWGKQDNWRIAGAMTGDDMNRTDLGNFLESL